MSAPVPSNTPPVFPEPFSKGQVDPDNTKGVDVKNSTKQEVVEKEFYFVQWLGRIWTWIKENILEPLWAFFQTIFPCCEEPIMLSIEPDMRTKILPFPEKLRIASPEILSKGLPNLYNTCYMNSVLQMIAHCNGFNALFESPLVEPVAGRYATSEAYQRAVQQHEDILLLRGHLAAIIQKLRDPDSQNVVERGELRILFNLLQVCGWRRRSTQQQDPQELLLFLRDVFGVEGTFQIGTVLSYEHSDVKYSRASILDGYEHEIRIEIPLDQMKKVTGPSNNMQTLFEAKRNPITEYRPEDLKDVVVDAESRSYILNQAPQTLGLHELRFSYTPEGYQYRKSGAMPTEKNFNCNLEVPIYRKIAGDGPLAFEFQETAHYRLTGAICHLGDSTSSGHYTFIGAHSFLGKSAWIHYNDNHTLERFESNSENSEILHDTISDMIKTRGYYLVYERQDP